MKKTKKIEELTSSPCKRCEYCIETSDEKWKLRITCPYSDNKEFLGGYLPQQINENCGHFKLKK